MSAAAPDVTLRVVADGKPAAAAPATASPAVIGGLGLLAGLAIAGLVVGLAVGLTKKTTTTTVTVPINGPANWGTIRNATSNALLYPLCADNSAGTSKQSPIDIKAASLTPGASVQPNRLYTSTEYKIKPRPGGHPGFQVVANDE